MATLLDSRYQEIAGFIEETALQFAPNDFSILFPANAAGAGAPFGSISATPVNRAVGQVLDAVNAVGYKEATLQTPGDQDAKDVWALNVLVSSGQITAAEAEAFLSQKYPNAQWSGGQWGGLNTQLAAESVIEASAKAAASGEALSPTEQAEAATSAQQPNGLAGSPTLPPAESQVYLDEMPEVYDPALMHGALESAFEQVSIGLAEVSQGRINYQPNSIPGTAIAPGSIPATAIRLADLQKRIASVQGFDESIGLALARSTGLDTDLDGGGGRVWRVSRPEIPSGWRPSLGFTRYRLIRSGQNFGVSDISFSLDGTLNPTFGSIEVEYGIIITGIPHFYGRPPVGLLAGIDSATASVPFTFLDSTATDAFGWGGTTRLFHDRADADYRTSPIVFMDTLGSGTLAPTDADINAATGFQITLITGTTADEVYETVNTLRPRLGPGVWASPSGHGPTVTVPPEAAAAPDRLAFTSAGVVELVGDPITPTARGESDAIDWTSVGQAGPISHSDCEALKATNTTFSVFVKVLGVRHSTVIRTGGNPTNWPSPSTWADVGVKLLGGTGRTWGIDIIVF